MRVAQVVLEIKTMKTIKVYNKGRLHAIWDVTGLAISEITPALRYFYLKGYTFKYEKGN